MTFATIALAALLAAPGPAAPVSGVAMTVEVRAAPKADPGVQAWAKELRAALETHKEEFRLVKTGEKAELTVRIDSVGAGPGAGQVMNGALVMGQTTRPFNLSYTGAARPQAEALARNLRKYADQMKTAPAPR